MYAVRCDLATGVPIVTSSSVASGILILLTDWLVITADQHGVGPRRAGLRLVWFLRTYFGRRGVAVHARPGGGRACLHADTVFLGLPIDARRLTKSRRSSADRPRAASWRSTTSTSTNSPGRPSRKPRSARATDRYLKPWFEPAVGLRPADGHAAAARTHRQLSLSIAWDRPASSAPPRNRDTTSAFSADPTDPVVGAGRSRLSASTSASRGSANCVREAPDLRSAAASRWTTTPAERVAA